MGIKCSLFGHAFGDSTVERDRQEQGSEVVSTIREVETCSRCGETRAVSENKEVTTLETPDDVDVGTGTPADDDPAGADPESTEADPAESEPSEPEQPPTGQDEAADPAPDIVEAETEADDVNVEPPAETEEAVSEEPPVTDDAEILDDDADADQPERDPGQWPQEAAETDEPDDQEFDQFGLETDEDSIDDTKTDAEFIDDDPEPPAEETQPQTNEWPSEEEIDAANDTEPAGPGAVTVPEGSFVCEGCGFSTPVESSSLREGDFCPDCHKETLVQVRDGE